MIAGSILLEDITVFDVYASNSRVFKYVRQKMRDLQGEIDESVMIAGDFSTLLRNGQIQQVENQQGHIELKKAFNLTQLELI